MPTYYARSINVRLSVADLTKTITPAPINTLCKDSTLNADRAVKRFEEDAIDGTLAETPLLCSDQDGCSLGFLGDHLDMPFFMVHAKPEYPFDSSTSGVSKVKEKLPPLRLPAVNGDNPDSPLTDLSSSSLSPILNLDSTRPRVASIVHDKQVHTLPRRSSVRQLVGTADGENNLLPASPQSAEQTSVRPSAATASATSLTNELPLSETYPGRRDSFRECVSNTQQPQALCLRVLPTAESFLRTLDPKAPWTYNDVKTDVYLNGDLCASAYVPERVFHSKGYTRDIFSGARNGRLTEKPWVLVPPLLDVFEHSADLTGPKQAEGDARNRWTEISDALKVAAESYGHNMNNKLSIVGQYLQSLAAIPIPTTLLGMLKTGYKRFAVIDVVVITGKGNKNPADGSYLSRPMPLKLHGYGSGKQSLPIKKLDKPEEQQPVAVNRLSRPKKSFADQQIAAQPFSFHHVPRNSADPSIYQAHSEGILSPQPVAKFTKTPSIPNTEQSATPNPPAHAPKRLPRIRKAPTSSRSNKLHVSTSKTPPIRGKRTSTPILVDSKERKRPQGSAMPTTLEKTQTKKRRIQYHEVIDTRQTAAEEMEDIARQAADKDAIFFTERRITRSKLANNSDDGEMGENSRIPEALSNVPPNDSQSHPTDCGAVCAPPPKAPLSEIAIETLPPKSATRQAPQALEAPPRSPRLRREETSTPVPVNRADSSSPEKPLILSPRPSQSLSPVPPCQDVRLLTPGADKNLNPAVATPQTHDGARNRLAKSSSLKKKLLTKPNKSTLWEIPPLSKDSIVTYPEGNVERQIRSERGGGFREEGVLVGVRFVVG
ncbi:MAG: hypothetical protein Q9225_000447 [Loekoesia sp. 1 TL-2023]